MAISYSFIDQSNENAKKILNIPVPHVVVIGFGIHWPRPQANHWVEKPPGNVPLEQVKDSNPPSEVGIKFDDAPATVAAGQSKHEHFNAFSSKTFGNLYGQVGSAQIPRARTKVKFSNKGRLSFQCIATEEFHRSSHFLNKFSHPKLLNFEQPLLIAQSRSFLYFLRFFICLNLIRFMNLWTWSNELWMKLSASILGSSKLFIHLKTKFLTYSNYIWMCLYSVPIGLLQCCR